MYTESTGKQTPQDIRLDDDVSATSIRLIRPHVSSERLQKLKTVSWVVFQEKE
jgi:Arc/MetJ family transcription regulator